jgi:hypothetical protein
LQRDGVEEDIEGCGTTCGCEPLGVRVSNLMQDLVCGGRYLIQSIYNRTEGEVVHSFRLRISGCPKLVTVACLYKICNFAHDNRLCIAERSTILHVGCCIDVEA